MKKNFNSAEYWEKRYKSGRNSGGGSYGDNCTYKASIINQFLEENNISSAIELGCGDGNQLSHIDYKKYYGYDVSETVVNLCKEKFANSQQFKFTNKINDLPSKAELSLSLDVIYHLIEDEVYEEYLKQLFDRSSEYVIIFSSNFIDKKSSEHVKHREFVIDIEKRIPNFFLYKTIETPKSIHSSANFYFFKKGDKNV